MTSRRLLIVDDDSLFCRAVTDWLARDGIEVVSCGTVAEARAQAGECFPVVLLDNQLPDGDGLTLAPELRSAYPRVQLILCTAFPELDNAVAALRIGAHDYITKPADLGVLRALVLRCLRAVELERLDLLERHRRDLARIENEIVGSSPGTVRVRELVARAAGARSPVLVTGETGTGKTLVARAIHQAGDGDRPFVAVNCAALPPELVESELFGSERGAFTGATQTREGLFELADGGTLFLDEVFELAPAIQAKLLTVLDDGQIRRVGGARSRKVDARVIAATNADPEAAVRAGTLRADLYYRLNVIRIAVPPLRERREEISVLSEQLLRRLSAGRDTRLAPGELERLADYPWPGNARELRNVLERALVLQAPEPLRPSELLAATATATAARPESAALADIERRHILATLEATGGNRSMAARELGVSIATLRRKLREYGTPDASN